VLGSPMHAWPFQTRLHHQFMAALHTSRPNRPALLKVGSDSPSARVASASSSPGGWIWG
jgi:hypothetical protein